MPVGLTQRNMSELTRLNRLVTILKDAPDKVFIQPHNVPDPDAIASCAGLRYLLELKGVKSTIVYDRGILKADSLMMLGLLSIEMGRVGETTTLNQKDWAVLVDGQKAAGNLTDLATVEVAVIDHHEYLGDQGYLFEDVRPLVGACSTIIAEYFIENSIEPPRMLATALIFGIMKDTDSLTRGVSDLDVDMFYRLYRYSDMSLIKQLNGSQLTMEDLLLYAKAFKTVEIYGSVGLMRLDSPDDSLLGAASDIVLSLNTVDVVVAYSLRPSGVRISARSETPSVKANALVRFVLKGTGVGGGHNHMAGGFMPFENFPTGIKLDTYIKDRTIKFIEGLRIKFDSDTLSHHAMAIPPAIMLRTSK